MVRTQGYHLNPWLLLLPRQVGQETLLPGMQGILSSQIFLLLSQDHTIAGGICYTSEHPTFGNLIIVKERLLFVVYGARDEFPCTSATSACFARRREINACFFCCFKNVLIVCTFNFSFSAIGGLKGDAIDRH